MRNELKIKFIPKKLQHSEYDWANIDVDGVRVGKVRCKLFDDSMTIFSINIFPDFERKGYAKEFVKQAKNHYDKIIADRVKYEAIGFWTKMGFKRLEDGNYLYKKADK